MSGSTSVGNKRVEEGEPNKKRVNVKRPFSENEGTLMTFKQRGKTSGRHLSYNILTLRSQPSPTAGDMIEINWT